MAKRRESSSHRTRVRSKPKMKPELKPMGSASELSEVFRHEVPLGPTCCFLCGCDLLPGNTSEEHVIPKWVQRQFDLWNQKLVLLNRTEIPYKNLTIPCCVSCNGKYLAEIESKVLAACSLGREAVLALPRTTLFLWMGKILYGLLYRENLLSSDQKQPGAGPIVPADLMHQFRLHHMFLQASRIPFEFSPEVPASIFVFDTLVPSNPKMGFDYWDELQRLGLSIRVGRVGIVACLQDGGALAMGFEEQYRRYRDFALHWIQFAEVTARVFYGLLRFNRVPKFISFEGKEKIDVVQSPLGGLSGKPLFDEGNMADYARVLAHCVRLPLETVHPAPDKVMSWLDDEMGQVKRMNADDLP